MTVTSGKAWRRDYEEGVEITLPSGKVASIKPVSTELLFILRRIPDALTQRVMDAFLNGGAFDLEVKDPEQYRLYLELRDAFVVTTFVNPKIVKEPAADDEVMIEAIDSDDRNWLMRFFNQPASALHSFRDEQERHVEPVDNGAGHEAAPVRPAESKPVGG